MPWMDATATRISIAVAGVIAVALPFAGFTSLMLVHFYVRGSFLMDTGLLASLMWHSDAALTMPPA